MRMNRLERNQEIRGSRYRMLRSWPVLVVFLGSLANMLIAQNANQDDISQQIQKLTDAMARTQAQVDESQRQLNEMQKQLKALQQQMERNSSAAAAPPSAGSASSSSAAQGQPNDIPRVAQDIRDRQAMLESQIATQEQTKVESKSKYPVKITGLLLLTGFVNTRAVDMASTPTLALPGSGNTGASVRQTVLGIDARGPHVFGATSYADLRVDFDGVPQTSTNTGTYSGPYSSSTALLRLRTAHVGLKWDHTEAFFSLDRPIFNPDTPTSLTAVAEPPLAWSGNLWTWNPQIGVRQEVAITSSRNIQFEAALMDVGDAPLSSAIVTYGSLTATPPSSAELSRWPGVEAHLAFAGPDLNGENGNSFGLGGYFAPHRTAMGQTFDSWAATADTRLLLPARFELTGSAYRGLALGGLGGGAYKDIGLVSNPYEDNYYLYPLDDAGGWAQLKEKISTRMELNGAFGMDDAFAGEVRQISAPGGSIYQNLSRNRTYTGNVIFKPSAYLLFSLEYRYLKSFPVFGPPADSNVIGLGAGFKF